MYRGISGSLELKRIDPSDIRLSSDSDDPRSIPRKLSVHIRRSKGLLGDILSSAISAGITWCSRAISIYLRISVMKAINYVLAQSLTQTREDWIITDFLEYNAQFNNCPKSTPESSLWCCERRDSIRCKPRWLRNSLTIWQSINHNPHRV